MAQIFMIDAKRPVTLSVWCFHYTGARFYVCGISPFEPISCGAAWHITRIHPRWANAEKKANTSHPRVLWLWAGTHISAHKTQMDLVAFYFRVCMKQWPFVHRIHAIGIMVRMSDNNKSQLFNTNRNSSSIRHTGRPQPVCISVCVIQWYNPWSSGAI